MSLLRYTSRPYVAMKILFQALGANQWLLYMTLGLILLSSVSILYLKIRNSGRDMERYEQNKSALEDMQRNAEIKLRVERASSSSARDRLRKQYSR